MLKGELLVAKREFPAAVELLSQLIQDEPKSARVHYFKGLAHFGQGDTRLASAALAKSLELEPGNLRAHLLLAEIALARSRRRPGPAGSGGGVEDRPGQLPGPADAGQHLHWGSRNSPRPRRPSKGSSSPSPNNPAGYYRLGQLYQSRGQYDPALQNYDKALAINPNLLDVFGERRPGATPSRSSSTRALNAATEAAEAGGRPRRPPRRWSTI